MRFQFAHETALKIRNDLIKMDKVDLKFAVFVEMEDAESSVSSSRRAGHELSEARRNVAVGEVEPLGVVAERKDAIIEIEPVGKGPSVVTVSFAPGVLLLPTEHVRWNIDACEVRIVLSIISDSAIRSVVGILTNGGVVSRDTRGRNVDKSDGFTARRIFQEGEIVLMRVSIKMSSYRTSVF